MKSEDNQSRVVKEEFCIRVLRADEIECRVATVNEKGASLLLFKDARVDLKILDETFGTFGWQRTHQTIDGNLYCTISLWDEKKKQWIAKQDVGTKSYSEQEKGQASDSFKRAAFVVGVGRELYTAPFIWIPAGKVKIQKKGDKYCTSDHFKVARIGYNERREIDQLEIVDSYGKAVFSLNPDKGENKTEKTGKEDKIALNVLQRELDRTGVEIGTVLERYHLQDISQMTPEQFENAINCLKKSRGRAA